MVIQCFLDHGPERGKSIDVWADGRGDMMRVETRFAACDCCRGRRGESRNAGPARRQ